MAFRRLPRSRIGGVRHQGVRFRFAERELLYGLHERQLLGIVDRQQLRLCRSRRRRFQYCRYIRSNHLFVHSRRPRLLDGWPHHRRWALRFARRPHPRCNRADAFRRCNESGVADPRKFIAFAGRERPSGGDRPVERLHAFRGFLRRGEGLGDLYAEEYIAAIETYIDEDKRLRQRHQIFPVEIAGVFP